MIRDAIVRMLDWWDEPMLVCRVRFTEKFGPWVEAFPPFSADTRLVVGTTGVDGEDAQPPRGELEPFPPIDGLHLSITRPSTLSTGPVSVICALAPIPETLLRFRLHGSFAYPEGPQGPDDQWAPSLVARGGVDILDTTDAAPVGATHQTRGDATLGGGWITLGAGTATDINPPPSNTSTWVTQQTAYDDHAKVFELWSDFDCYEGIGRSTLTTSPVPDHEWNNSWRHKYKVPKRGASSPGIMGIGVGLGIAKGTGTASVAAKQVLVYAWFGPAPWWRRLITNMLSL